MKVKNPTPRTKAVRLPGRDVIVAPGKEADLGDAKLTDDERERYEAAGLKFAAAKAPAKKAEGGS